MPPLIVITLDIIKYRRTHYIPADKTFSVDAFYFPWVEEAFHTGIIIVATLCAHAAPQIIPFQQA